MLSWLAKIDTHMILIAVLLTVAVWAAIKSVTSSRNKSWLVLMGVAFGGAGILIFLRWYNKKLLKESNEIQKERDVIAEDIKVKQDKLAKLTQQDSLEEEKLHIQIATQQKAQEEKDKTGRELEGMLDDLGKKYGF